MLHLKESSYYQELYDLSTIRACLDRIELYLKTYRSSKTDPETKDFSDHEREKTFNHLLSMQLMHLKTERYRQRAETIEAWIERDRVKQDLVDSTPEPPSIRCTECAGGMSSTMKHLEDYTDTPLRVLFFFECSKCKKRKGIYDNGEERVVKPSLCAQCGGELESTTSEKAEVVTITTTCSVCGLSETKVDDLGAWEKDRKQSEEEDKALLAKYRDEFCFSDKEGEEHIELMEAMAFAPEVFEYEKQKHYDPGREALQQLKRLNIVELERLLTQPLEDAKYTKLSFEKPDMGHHLVVPFTLQDADSTRKGDSSVKPLEKLIRPLLESTNWRLSGSLSYRLGYVSGRLKGYEYEEELLKLASKEAGPTLKPIDPDKLMQYGGNNVVQLARLMGELEGIKNRRTRRLKQEPDGFFLGSEEGPYSCGICLGNHPGNQIWWNLQGLRCADCRRNTLEGVIPKDLSSRPSDTWFADWQIQGDHGVHAATAKKLRRQGLLHGRDLKRPDGTTYYTLYLVRENQEFLDQYPRKGRTAQPMKTTDVAGDQIML